MVDCIEGVSVQIETALQKAIKEKVKPILMINKVDRHILELKSEGEAIYQSLTKVVDVVNIIIETCYQGDDMGDVRV